MRILRIKNYEKYQRHEQKNPTWIRLYRSLLTDRDFLRLSVSCRYIYVCLLILASETSNCVVNDTTYLSHRLATPVSESDLTALFHSGLLVASRSTIARRKKPSETETERGSERERETETGMPLTPVVDKPLVRKKKLDTEWPEGFVFNERHESIATGLGLNVHSEFIKFKDKSQSKGWMYKDWEAGFRTWLNNAADFKQQRATR